MILKQLMYKLTNHHGVSVHTNNYGLFREDHKVKHVKCWTINNDSSLNLVRFQYEMKGYTFDHNKVPLEFFAFLEFLFCNKPEDFDLWFESQKKEAQLREIL